MSARLAALALVAVLATPVAAGGGFPLTLRDALGRAVVIPRPPARIISLAPSVTETVFAVGAGGRLVGVSNAETFPPEARRITPVGGVSLDFERIARLGPDLIIGVAGLQRPQLEQLVARGFPVFAVDPRSVRETLDTILVIGRVTGSDAAPLVARLRREAGVITASVAGLPRVSVYVEVWGQPFVTTGRGTYLDDLIRLAGGRNVFGDLRDWPTVAEEQIIARAPQAILLTYPGQKVVLGRRSWASVPAVRRGRVYVLDSDLASRPGPRVVAGLREIADALHPERRR